MSLADGHWTAPGVHHRSNAANGIQRLRLAVRTI
jgi:hypothetical protein